MRDGIFSLSHFSGPYLTSPNCIPLTGTLLKKIGPTFVSCLDEDPTGKMSDRGTRDDEIEKGGGKHERASLGRVGPWPRGGFVCLATTTSPIDMWKPPEPLAHDHLHLGPLLPGPLHTGGPSANPPPPYRVAAPHPDNRLGHPKRVAGSPGRAAFSRHVCNSLLDVFFLFCRCSIGRTRRGRDRSPGGAGSERTPSGLPPTSRLARPGLRGAEAGGRRRRRRPPSVVVASNGPAPMRPIMHRTTSRSRHDLPLLSSA
jgi:hypothetical protein